MVDTLMNDDQLITPKNVSLTLHQLNILRSVNRLSIRPKTPFASIKEISSELSKPEESIRTTVYSLCKRGYLIRHLRGSYILTDAGRVSTG